MDPDLLLPAPETVRAGVLIARADAMPATFDEKSLEVDVVMGSGVAVVRAPWFDEPYIEELSMDPAHVRMERLNSGRAPLLDQHQRYELENQIGVVKSCRLEGGKLAGRVRFSRREDIAAIVADVRDGIYGNLSIGYRVHKFQDVTMPTDSMRRLRAIDWEPMECSLVTVPADPTSEVRAVARVPEKASNGALVGRSGDALTNCVIQGLAAKTKTMTPEEIAAQEAARAAAQSKPTAPAPAPAVAVPDTGEAVRAEQARCAEASRLASRFALPNEWLQRMIADGTKTVEALQRCALEALAARSDASAGMSHPEMGEEPRDKSRKAIEAVLEYRMGVSPALRPEGRPFGGARITRMAEEHFASMGIRTGELSPNEFANLALKGSTGTTKDREVTRGLMSTSDFAQLLSNVQNKGMRKRYEATPQTWLKFARRTETPDFKPMRRIQLSGGTGLKRVNEHGEFERGSMSDQAENYSLNTEGIIYGFTRRAFLNDDLGELSRVTEVMGRRAADRRSDLVYSLITANANLADGLAWFEAAVHKNLDTGGGSVLAAAGLATMLSKMRKQTDAEGNLLNIRPAFLVVPAALEVTAFQLTTTITPALSSSVNKFQGFFEDVIVEPRLDAASLTAWFAFASPSQVDVIEYAELAGQSGPQMMIRNGFEVDGIEYRISDDFGAAPLEYVSAYKSAGA
jgi:hypothetical protein